MRKLAMWISRFMQGRYGIDETYYLLLILWFVFYFCSLFTKEWVSVVFMVLSSLTFVFAVFRSLSKNRAMRERENRPLRKALARIRSSRALRKNKRRDRHTHVYRKCKKCGAVMRLPRIKGEHTATCPKCREKNKIKVR